MKINAVTRGVFRRLGLKSPPCSHDGIDSELSPVSIPEDYKALITQCFRRLGLPEDGICISVRPVGQRSSGQDVYAAFVKVTRWDASVASMFNELPTIEKMIDRGIRRSDMSRYSSFAGVWFRSPPKSEERPAVVH
ncbi:hypothetical protein [Hydrogenophaga sp.]|uniref:hypothetical protein n=1 Tax=Hydrogenophaga sp. TaxID=1904254 RepID=UPI003D0DAEC1